MVQKQTWTNKRDAQNPQITADMFYIPFEVNSFETQIEKIFWTKFMWGLPLFNQIMGLNNLISWCTDYINGNQLFFPSMYTNNIAREHLDPDLNAEGPTGVFNDFDMFSFKGFMTYDLYNSVYTPGSILFLVEIVYII
jgi:hypothetical protein